MHELIHRLNDENLSLAEVARRVGAAAVVAGMTRPSPVHVRALLAEERARRRDEREILEAGLKALSQFASQRAPSPFEIQRAMLRAEESVEERARRRGR